MSRRPRATIQELREAVQSLPRATRVAMLDGLAAGPIIAGAYTSGDGVCPMLAAHRAGGRCNAPFFADAWDRFAFRDGRRRRAGARRASERELRILRTHLEASLLDDELADVTLAGARHAHQALLARRPATGDHAPPIAKRAPATADHAPATAYGAPTREDGPEPRPTPGDHDRAPELRGRPGWAWSRLFRRYDEYAAALDHLQAATDPGGPSERRSDRADAAHV